MSVIYVDIDETICVTPASRKYTDAQPITKHIEKINRLYDEGNTIIYWTSRGSRKQIDWREVTEHQLKAWGAKYHELRLDKPYYDILFDDKAMRIESA